MDYIESLHYVLSFTNLAHMRHVPYEKRVWLLDRIQGLLDALGRPQDDFPAIHIAGTKGKGSTAAMIDSVLQAAGLRPGLYTSPHLHTFRERVRVNGELISRDAWIAQVQRIREVVDTLPLRPNTFDVLTALAFRYFADERVPIAVVEVGLGGRLDSTNVVHPVLTLITSLGLEHTAILGPTLQHVAREKGGIIKDGVPVIIAPQPPQAMEVLETIAAEHRARFIVLGRDWHYRLEAATREGIRVSVWNAGAAYENVDVSLRGRHQAINAAMAIIALHTLRDMGWPVQEHHIRQGLKNVRWPARMEILQAHPTLLLDAAHTIESMTELAQSIERWFPGRRVHALFGVSQDKPIEALLSLLWPLAESVFITRSEHPRAASPDFILQNMPDFPGPDVYTYTRAEDALAAALTYAAPHDIVCTCGSIFLAAAIREIWAHEYGQLPEDDWVYQSDFPYLRRSVTEPGRILLRKPSKGH